MRAVPAGHALNESPFFRLKNKAKLAELLGTDRKSLLLVVANKNKGTYREWDTAPRFPKSKHPDLQHKPRRIQEPTGALLHVQDRLNVLLSRIKLPDYLHSARKGRSYRTNAAKHIHAGDAFRIDIRRFYQSAQDVYVDRFFREVLECAPDVAHILTEIACFRRRLPTGSPLSPLISFLAYAPMFDEIYDLAISLGATMTVYVDDIVFSGGGTSGEHVHECGRILRKYELIGHKIEYFLDGQARVVTGLSVEAGRLGITKKRQRKIRALREEFERERDPVERRRYGDSLLGLLRESGGIDASMLPLAKKIEEKLR